MITASYVAFGVKFGEDEGQQDTLYNFPEDDVLTVMAARSGHEDVLREELAAAIDRFRQRLGLDQVSS